MCLFNPRLCITDINKTVINNNAIYLDTPANIILVANPDVPISSSDSITIVWETKHRKESVIIIIIIIIVIAILTFFLRRPMSVCMAVFANCRSQLFLVERLGRCL